MSAIVVQLDIFGPVLLAGIGWIIRELRANRKHLLDNINALSSRQQIMEIRAAETNKDVEGLMRDFPNMQLNLGILLQEMEAHQQWHRDNKPAG